MASAPSDGPIDGRFPSADTLARLRASLGEYLRAGQSAEAEAAVCETFGVLAQEARAHHLHGEHVLLVLKDAWQHLEEVGMLRDHMERQRLLGRLVTLCIDTYYRR